MAAPARGRPAVRRRWRAALLPRPRRSHGLGGRYRTPGRSVLPCQPLLAVATDDHRLGARIMREGVDSGRDTRASAWHKRSVYKRLTTTEAPALRLTLYHRVLPSHSLCSTTRSCTRGASRSACEATTGGPATRASSPSSQESSSAGWICRRPSVETSMMDDELRTALGSMVERYGLATVSRILHELEAGNAGPNAGRALECASSPGPKAVGEPGSGGRPWTTCSRWMCRRSDRRWSDARPRNSSDECFCRRWATSGASARRTGLRSPSRDPG